MINVKTKKIKCKVTPEIVLSVSNVFISSTTNDNSIVNGLLQLSVVYLSQDMNRNRVLKKLLHNEFRVAE